MGFGGAELLIVIAILILPVVLCIVVVVDAANRPPSAWEAAGQNKTLWIVLPIVLLVACGLPSVVASVIYLAAIRPKVKAAAAV